MAWGHIASTTWITDSGRANGTSAALTTTGADLLIIAVNYFTGNAPAFTPSDSKGNTWHALTAKTSGNIGSKLYYAWNATVGTNHTFTVNSSQPSFYGCGVAAFSGSNTASDPFDAEVGAVGSSNSLAAGSLGGSGKLLVSDLCVDSNGDTKSVSTGTKILDIAFVGGTSEGLAFAWKEQTGADNPSWSWTNAGTTTLVNATFNATAGVDLGSTLLIPSQDAQMPRTPRHVVAY